MNLAAATVHPGALFVPRLDRAVGPVAAELRERLTEALARQSSVTTGRHEEIVSRLARALQDASKEGVYALAGTPGRALEFMQSLPTDVPLPDVVVESDGEMGLDWDVSRRRVLSVSVGEGPMLRFAALIGPEPVHGRVAYGGVLPSTLAFFLQRVHAA